MKVKNLPLFLIFGLLMNTAVALDYEFFEEKKFEVPEREVSIIATEDGFYPKSIFVFRGEKVKFFLTSTTNRPSCLIINEKNIFISAAKGQITETEAFFDEEGSFEFFCPTDKVKGRLTVMERPDDKRARIAREIASYEKSRIKIWVPRDE